MKIRLVSIEGKIADPLYNEQQMEKEITKALGEGIDLLVFPSNSIRPVSLDDMRYNETYWNNYEIALSRLKQAISFIGMNVVFDDEPKVFNFKNYTFRIHNNAQEETLESLINAEKILKRESLLENTFIHLVCFGRGTESTCQKVYSNIKMIAYDGKILASNLDTDANILNLDFPIETKTRYPYLTGIDDLDKMFKNILNLQGVGLYGKMKSMNRFKICMGVSGGLDSTVSLLACVEIFKKYNLPLKNIIGVTMPGLGTTERTHKNALALMKGLGITIEEIDLRPLLKTHLENISQPEGKFDVTFEQTQSRERTQVLLDIANRDNAIMIGTGCMSEFALGWMTYGGDHLCMYAINIGLPKTVVKMYAKWFINKLDPSIYNEEDHNVSKHDADLAAVIKNILDGPVSPELLPIDDKGEQYEKTESLIGDYAVQDFFIYHMTVSNWSIEKIFNETLEVFPEYTPEQILKWLDIFTLRYFTRAYKKNCYGDGLQLFKYSVSPWYKHVPSDIDNTIWKEEIESLKKEMK